MPQLNNGDQFPHLTVNLTDGDTMDLPGGLAGHYGVILLFRGAWCPFCNAQLRAFQLASESLAEADARIVAISTEDEDTTKALIRKHSIGFAVGHSANAHLIHQATGAYVNEQVPNIEATDFVLTPEGKILVAVYSTSSIGRLVPDDVLGLVRYHRDRAAQATT
jgi:peroxiredoxin